MKKGKWEVCDKETDEWHGLLAEFYKAVDVLDAVTTERKNGKGTAHHNNSGEGGTDWRDQPPG